ncbi:MAG: hypothetical protein V2J55_03190 [Candidatus Competibacteraceae bacterium]|jgi:hypothetical protein|nr:hypothetical protein [Candidatus Competibacteraceae bacterium]
MNEPHTDSAEAEQKPLWRYVPLQQFARPKPSVGETARKGFLGLFWRFRRYSDPDEDALIQGELQRLPETLRDQVTPAPDWTILHTALDDAFHKWLKADRLKADTTADRLSVLIAMPGSGQSEALSHWALSHEVLVLDPPAPEQLLAGADCWLDNLPQDPAIPLVVPTLDHFYLRHIEGLQLIRQLLYWLANWPGRCLLGCSSWAWAYLSKALRVDTLLTNVWTLDALDSERLQIWFSQLAKRHDKKPVNFRQTDNGFFIIPPPSLDEHNTDGKSDAEIKKELWGDWKLSNFLIDLAAYSRGNPAVAWAIWRHSLGQLSEDETEKHDLHDAAETIWVKPWQDLRLPSLPHSAGQSELFVLHTLLLHDGMTALLLSQLLPLSPFEIQRVLTSLGRFGIVEKIQERWQINPLAYHSVRETLDSEGFLVDNPG